MNSASALARALRGPAMLTTLGILFAADHQSGWAFYKTWPVLVIVFGLIKFWEISISRGVETPTGGAGPFPGGVSQ